MRMKFKIYNPEHSIAIQQILLDLGYSWYEKSDISYIYAKYLFTYKDKLIKWGKDQKRYESSEAKEMTLDDLYNIPNPTFLKLNSTYTAEIKKDKVIVGCQEIELGKIKELHKKIKKLGYYNK